LSNLRIPLHYAGAIIGPIVAAALVFGSAVAAPTAPSPSPSPVTTLIEDYAYKPPSITIHPGTTVVWTNKDDDPHTVTADDKLFDSKGLCQGDTYHFTFEKPGRYTYHCAAHPFMKGVIIVTEGDGK
jgi:plastocyanin